MAADPRHLVDLLERLAARGEDAAFVRGGDTEHSGPRVARDARALAAALLGSGLSPGERVAIYLEKGPLAVVAIFACAAAGLVSVIVNPRLKDAQVRHILADSGARLLLASFDKMLLLQDAAGTVGEVPLVLTYADAGLAIPHRGMAELLAGPRGELPPVDPRAPATILYTSGSTGLPKGIVQDQHNLALGAAVVGRYLGLSAGDHVLAVLPFSFDYGLNQVLAAAWAGAQVTTLDYLGMADVFTELRELRCTGLAAVPTFWREFASWLRKGEVRPETLRALRYVTNSGGRLAVEDIRTLRRELPWVQVFSMYGLTEAFRSAFLPPSEIDRRPLSFGKPVEGVRLLVVDPETGRAARPGEVGELVHAGAFVAHGYWNRPADTARAFRAHPFAPQWPGRVVFSGDLVREDEEGFLYFVGRRDGQLKVSGYRVSPDEVEEALRGVSGVALAAVFGVPDESSGHRLIACVSPAPGAPADLASHVVGACRRLLPFYMVPAEVRVVREMPLNQNRKVDVPALKAQLGFAEGRSAP